MVSSGTQYFLFHLFRPSTLDSDPVLLVSPCIDLANQNNPLIADLFYIFLEPAGQSDIVREAMESVARVATSVTFTAAAGLREADVSRDQQAKIANSTAENLSQVSLTSQLSIRLPLGLLRPTVFAFKVVSWSASAPTSPSDLHCSGSIYLSASETAQTFELRIPHGQRIVLKLFRIGSEDACEREAATYQIVQESKKQYQDIATPNFFGALLLENGRRGIILSHEGVAVRSLETLSASERSVLSIMWVHDSRKLPTTGSSFSGYLKACMHTVSLTTIWRRATFFVLLPVYA